MRNRVPVANFFFSGLFFIVMILVVLAFLGVLGWLGYSRELEFLWVAGAVAGVWVLTVLTFWVVRSPLQCPLCRAYWFSGQKCARNPKVRFWFGSHRLPLAIDGLRFAKRTRCNFCGTSVRCRGQSRSEQNSQQTRRNRPTTTMRDR